MMGLKKGHEQQKKQGGGSDLILRALTESPGEILRKGAVLPVRKLTPADRKKGQQTQVVLKPPASVPLNSPVPVPSKPKPPAPTPLKAPVKNASPQKSIGRLGNLGIVESAKSVPRQATVDTSRERISYLIDPKRKLTKAEQEEAKQIVKQFNDDFRGRFFQQRKPDDLQKMADKAALEAKYNTGTQFGLGLARAFGAEAINKKASETLDKLPGMPEAVNTYQSAQTQSPVGFIGGQFAGEALKYATAAKALRAIPQVGQVLQSGGAVKRIAAASAVDLPMDIASAALYSEGDGGRFVRELGLNVGMGLGTSAAIEGIGAGIRAVKGANGRLPQLPFAKGAVKAETGQQMSRSDVSKFMRQELEQYGEGRSTVDDGNTWGYTEGSRFGTEGAGKSVKYFDDVHLKTESNKSYFWSGKSNGVGGPENAAKIAGKNGGVTLETTLESQGIKMPEFNINDPAAVKAWQSASTTYASQVSGEVRAIVGSNVNPKGIWNTFELPALKANPNVTKIILIDPETLVETIIFTR